MSLAKLDLQALSQLKSYWICNWFLKKDESSKVRCAWDQNVHRVENTSMSEWTKTRNHERSSHISDSSDTNSKAFIYVVSNISTCLVLRRVVQWWVANHEIKWFSQYEDDQHQQQSQQYEKQYHIWSEFAKSWIVSSLIFNQRRFNDLEHLFTIVDNLVSRSKTVSKHGWECSLRYLVSSESAIEVFLTRCMFRSRAHLTLLLSSFFKNQLQIQYDFNWDSAYRSSFARLI